MTLPKKISANISSSTLFHFTDKLDWIIDSLEHGFPCRYFFEKLPLARSGYIAPVKCFCDIPLSLIKPHLGWYGNYGLGLDKSFAFKNGITPVIYIPKGSPIAEKIFYDNHYRNLENDPLLPFYKMYSGTIKNKQGIERNRRFYNEREWRYFAENYILAFRPNYSDKEITKELNHYNSLKLPRLNIDFNKLEYIIIEEPNELKSFLPILKRISKKMEVDYEILISKILTSRQIYRDF